MATAIIPAHNEAETVGTVVATAHASPLVDDVVVVDGGSSDGTGAAAEAAGARTIPVEGEGKGEAMAAGVAATDDEVIVFLDADLRGLRADHVDRLVRSVTTRGAVMACGLFDRGRWLNPLFLHVGPVLTGERALRRELFTSLAPDDVTGYRIEAALNARAAELGAPVAIFVCDGMWHRTKEEKAASPWRGLGDKIAMLRTALGNAARFTLRRWVTGRSREHGGDHRWSDGNLATPTGSSERHEGSSPGADTSTSSPSSSQRNTAESPSQSSA